MATLDESGWTLRENSVTLCRLEHRIPRFGTLAFVLEAGRPLRLELESAHRLARGIKVELRAESAGWNTQVKPRVLARLKTSGRKPVFSMADAVAAQTYDLLRQGYHAGFLFYAEMPFMATASMVRFGPAEAEFSHCGAQLYPDNFDDVRVTSIHFEPDDEFASIDAEQTAFTRMLEYLAVDRSVSEIVVTGHADQTGLACYNEGLSERRALYVYDLLVNQGIDSSLLRVDYFGEHKPAAKGNRDSAHAANRRVTVELRR